MKENSPGLEILRDKIKRDDTSADVLYFKFHVEPLSDAGTEVYHAAFQLFDGGQGRLGLGNAPEAWAYSAFNTAETGASNQVSGEFDLRTSRPEPSGLGEFKPYELPRLGNARTIVFRIRYQPGADDLVTVWLGPDLSRGATETNQLEILTTTFRANASFDQVRLSHGGGGDGWRFSNMMIATSFDDLIVTHFWETWWVVGLATLGMAGLVAASVRLVERRKFQLRMQRADQERALERERARIAEDLHDDLGSSLTRITLLSDLAKADQSDPAQLEVHINKIVQSAAQSVQALEEIVWAVRPGSDTLQSLIEYLTHFANELFDGSGVGCRLDLPHDLPVRPLPPDIRHNIFLVIKEALTNALRHSGASEVRVRAMVSHASLEIQVSDNGHGFNPHAINASRKGNGLGNMRRRADAMGAKLDVQTGAAQGTTVKLGLNFPPERA